MLRAPEFPLTIAHVLAARRLEAVERQVFDLAAAQASAGHQVHVVNLSGTRVIGALPAGVHHQTLHLPWFRVARLNGVLRHLHAHVCHGHGVIACRIVADSDAPVRVGTLHAGYEHHLHSALDGVISGSAAQLPRHWAYRGPSQVIHDWIPASVRPAVFEAGASDARHRLNLRRALGLPRDRVLVGALMSRLRCRGIETLVEAFRRFGPGHAVLVVIGDIRWKRRFSRLVGGQPGIHFLEALEDLSGILPDLDLLISTSEGNDPTTPLLMAMQCGLPIVAVDTPIIRQLLESSPATLVPGSDPEELGIAIRACVRGLRYPCTGSTPKRLRYDMSRHDRTAAVAHIEDFYWRLMARKSFTDAACIASAADVPLGPQRR